MNIVFLSPHFPPHYFRFCQNLKETGANVLGVGDEAYDTLSQDVRTALTEYYQVDEMHNYDALVRACGFFTHRYGKIDRLDSLNEYWLSTEARLRDDFNIVGVRGNEIDFIRRKSCMKAKFREAYDRYIVEEVIGFIRHHCQSPQERVMANGCSMGAYHAVNFF